MAGYVPLGLAAGASMPWTNTGDDAISAVFHFRREGERTVAAIIPPEQIVTFAALPLGTEGVISGRPLLVRAGSVVTRAAIAPSFPWCSPSCSALGS